MGAPRRVALSPLETGCPLRGPAVFLARRGSRALMLKINTLLRDQCAIGERRDVVWRYQVVLFMLRSADRTRLAVFLQGCKL